MSQCKFAKKRHSKKFLKNPPVPVCLPDTVDSKRYWSTYYENSRKIRLDSNVYILQAEYREIAVSAPPTTNYIFPWAQTN